MRMTDCLSGRRSQKWKTLGRKLRPNRKSKWKRRGESIDKEKMHIIWCFSNSNNNCWCKSFNNSSNRCICTVIIKGHRIRLCRRAIRVIQWWTLDWVRIHPTSKISKATCTHRRTSTKDNQSRYISISSSRICSCIIRRNRTTPWKTKIGSRTFKSWDTVRNLRYALGQSIIRGCNHNFQ